MPLVGVVMGSKSDAGLMQPALDNLNQLGIEYEVSVLSAHRTPEKARQYGLSARERGLEACNTREKTLYLQTQAARRASFLRACINGTIPVSTYCFPGH